MRRARESPIEAVAPTQDAWLGRSLQLATLADAVDAPDAYVYELKYDGYRIAALKIHGKLRLISRGGQDWAGDFPAVVEALAQLSAPYFVIDGEVCAPDERGVPSFQRLQDRQIRATPIVYVAFDLLELGERNLRGLPLEQRRAMLEKLLGDSPPPELRLSTEVDGDPREILSFACKEGFEGIVAKRKGSAYLAGRAPAWLKVKCAYRQEFAIIGYLVSRRAEHAVGSLLLAVSDGKTLRYAGRVGAGFSERTRRDLAVVLDSNRVKVSAATDAPSLGKEVRWCEPKLVAEVAFHEWTTRGLIRAPSFQGLRPDKTPLDCVMEMPASHPAAAVIPARTAGGADRAPTVSGITITHASRLLNPAGLTKLELARYYEAVGARMLRHVRGRPLTLVRWSPNAGEYGGTYLRHARAWGPKALRRVPIQEKTKVGEYLIADTPAALVTLAQMDILEIHTWNCTVDDVEHPDRIIFDIDPDVSLLWPSVVVAAKRIRQRLSALDLVSFVKTTGGKGLHVVVPLTLAAGWDECLAFTRRFAQSMQTDYPGEYVATKSKAQRRGKIFIDYLRNNRGSTSVAAWSTRARPGAPVSVPMDWAELDTVDPTHMTFKTAIARDDSSVGPWPGYGELRQSLAIDNPRTSYAARPTSTICSTVPSLRSTTTR